MQHGYQEGNESAWWWKVAQHLDDAQLALSNAMAHNVDDPRPVQALYGRLREGQAILLEIFRMKGLLPAAPNGRTEMGMPGPGMQGPGVQGPGVPMPGVPMPEMPMPETASTAVVGPAVAEADHRDAASEPEPASGPSEPPIDATSSVIADPMTSPPDIAFLGGSSAGRIVG